MSIIGLLILLVLVGAGLYLLNLAPIDPTIKQVIRIVVIVVIIIVAILVLAQLFGLSTGFPTAPLRR